MGQRTLLKVNDHFPNILSISEIKERLIERKEILYLLQEETRNIICDCGPRGNRYRLLRDGAVKRLF